MTSIPRHPFSLSDATRKIARDLVRHHQLSKPLRDRADWVTVNGVRTVRPRHGRDSFPPQNLMGARDAGEVMKALVFSLDGLDERPRDFVDLTPHQIIAERIIDLPTITADVVEAIADGTKKLAQPLADKLDRTLGLEGMLARHGVTENRKDAAIIDLPFKMNALHYTGTLASHGQLLNDLMETHGTDPGQLAANFKIHGLNAMKIRHIAHYHSERDALPADIAEPGLGWALSAKFDQDLFGMENGPFTHYCAYRMATRDDTPFHAYKAYVTPGYSYADRYKFPQRLPEYSQKHHDLQQKRTDFYNTLAGVTDRRIVTPLDVTGYGFSIGTVLGLAPLQAKDKEIVHNHPELQAAGAEHYLGSATPQRFVTRAARQDYVTRTRLYQQGYVLANQTKKSYRGFNDALTEIIAAAHPEIAKTKDVDADRVLGGAFYAVAANGQQGAPAWYLTKPFVHSLMDNDILVPKNRSKNPRHYINRAVPV